MIREILEKIAEIGEGQVVLGVVIFVSVFVLLTFLF